MPAGQRPTVEFHGRGNVSDHLANERTFLAWIRTSLALVGFGFLLARVGLFLRQIAVGNAQPQGIRHGHDFMITGIIFLLLGTALAAWSGWHHWSTLLAIENNSYSPNSRAILAVTVLAVLAGITIITLVVIGSVT